MPDVAEVDGRSTYLRHTYPDELLLKGNTGLGRSFEVHQVGPWVEITFEDREGERRGFALNPYYTERLREALALSDERKTDG